MQSNWTGSLADPVWIRPEWPTDAVRGLFSFRHGGVSEAEFSSLNVGFHVGDDLDAAVRNRRICADAIGGSLDEWVVPEQVHGNRAAVVTAADRGRGATPALPPIADVDAVVTADPDVTLAVLSADCVPVLFYDPVQHVAAAAHSGWRGTASHMVQSVLQTMRTAFGTAAADTVVWLGPSIRRCCYEVSLDVADTVQREFGARPLLARRNREDKFLLSLQACIVMDLAAAGVPRAHIRDTGVCTACHTDVLFSHRAEHGRTGRFLGAVRLQARGR